MNTALSLFSFVAVIALIPLLLWLLKRSPIGRLAGVAGTRGMRIVGSQALAPHQRLLTVEVGEGESRCWLLLGVTAHNISTLHTMAALDPAPPPAAAGSPATPFAELIKRLRRDNGGRGAN